jgi:rhamnosyltransferase
MIHDSPEWRVGIVIPTLNAGDGWEACLTAMDDQSFKPARRLIIDSSSTDDTRDLGASFGFEILQIPRSEFNHGGTRQRAVDHLDDCDIIVFLTQDAILAAADSLHQIVRCFDDPTVAVAYGRQLPRKSATPIEAHARLFNYTEITQRKDLSMIPKLGTKTFFCSNSFAAYRRSTLLEIGGFRSDLILEEDAEYAARAVLRGYANVYCATAAVYHSHDYTTFEQFARYFDLGVFDAGNRWMREQFGSHTGEGLRFIKSEVSYLASLDAWPHIPYGFLQTAAKLLGYRLGRVERWIPRRLKLHLSMSKQYW